MSLLHVLHPCLYLDVGLTLRVLPFIPGIHQASSLILILQLLPSKCWGTLRVLLVISPICSGGGGYMFYVLMSLELGKVCFSGGQASVVPVLAAAFITVSICHLSLASS